MPKINTLTVGANLDIDNSSGAYFSARGLSRVLDRLAKNEGRGQDLSIDVNCNMNDIFRASVRMGMDVMQARDDQAQFTKEKS